MYRTSVRKPTHQHRISAKRTEFLRGEIFFSHFPLYLLSFLFSVSPFWLKRSGTTFPSVKCSPLDDFFSLSSFFSSFFPFFFFMFTRHRFLRLMHNHRFEVERENYLVRYLFLFIIRNITYRNVNVLDYFTYSFVTLSFVHG